MHEVVIKSSQLPLVREIGFMKDEQGVLRHPNRLMKHINVFVFVKKGRLQVCEEGKEYILTAGDYLFLKQDVRHWGEELYMPGSEWYYIHFYQRLNDSDQERYPEFSPFQQSKIMIEEVYDTILTLPKQGKCLNPDLIELQLAKIVKDSELNFPIKPLHVSTLTYQFFLDLYTEKINASQNSRTNHVVNQMITMFKKTENKRLKSTDIAKELGMNYTYLSTLFKQQTGKTITQFQNELLMEKAIDLFKKSDRNVSEVSEALGFSNPYYFSRVFKKVTGVSPSNYLSHHYLN
ncbi:AraC family transcriptional regulator [Aquibacillus salsiterrae]|uniref:AraC family transcriptional regulator n=1 Tax=Aquibacillus salsiterrae TaxID=2950439 RepID=A0A9X4AEG3_9BACI|nr:AraC family transcriptional regulator [Aquibacillus salsiterrae]MDC3416857.1 AraC family transcriptional regulator [Aquibacillus salsiterrae]